ncbi:hypothetical protein GWG65_03470 [Bradyrhizobium sp. CSA207]|uniref:hypothetical protein n=1 Tax=Bradyrhizobium sp. CSA207 TaxID=2698826 RepID=UPI0023B0EAF2|nr:hypothetical protein [Bradyrhizobium sp. CSA207]MDE5440523.1 hypothetical protein [Bradyrhizobium sp. CSA207]
MKYCQWYAQRRREARAAQEAADPALARRRERSRRCRANRKQKLSEMETAFLMALNRRAVEARQRGGCGNDKVTLPVGEVLARELSQVLRALDRARHRSEEN